MRTAVLFCEYGSRASYYDDWLDAFTQAEQFQSEAFNIANTAERDAFRQSVADYELIVLLHSANADQLIYANEVLAVLQNRKGKLLSFVGNELSLPGAPLAPKIDFLKRVGADYIATQLLQETGEFLYRDTGAVVHSVPHALNPNAFKPDSNPHRPIDIGLRSFRYPAVFLGDNDRNAMIDYIREMAGQKNLVVDIETEARMERSAWAGFLNTCKATISTEAGGHWVEPDDATLNSILDWIRSKNKQSKQIVIPSDSMLRKLAHRLPWGVRQWIIKILKSGPIKHESLIGSDEDFDEVFQRFFKDKPFPPRFSGKCISSRHFDAIGTHTCQIMLAGRYNDILSAGEHYIELKRDYSNVDDALDAFRDETFRLNMVRRTREYICENHTYSHRIDAVYQFVTAT